MGVLIAEGKSLKPVQIPGFEGIFTKNASEAVDGATASAGKAKMEKGAMIENFTYAYGEIQYMISGTQILVVEGKTLVAHEGDFIHIQKGTTINQGSDDGCELMFITLPSLKIAGIV